MKRKSLNYYLSLDYPFKIESLSDEVEKYRGIYPDLDKCIVNGISVKEIIFKGKEKKDIYIKEAYKQEKKIPQPFTKVEI